MSELHLLCVGKLKDRAIESLENDYKKRLSSLRLSIHELRAHGEDLDKEAKEIEKKLQELNLKTPILLTEKGRSFDSPSFSKWLFQQFESDKKIALIIGGAAGFHPRLYQAAKEELSLGTLTFPHRLARLLIVEQLYRAECIKQGHPYHK